MITTEPATTVLPCSPSEGSDFLTGDGLGK